MNIKNGYEMSNFYFFFKCQQQGPPRQQDNFFQISPRPFAIQPNGNHGVQFVRPPIVPQSQQYTAEQNNNQFQFPQQSFQPQQQQQQPHSQLLISNDGSLEQQRQPIALQQVSDFHLLSLITIRYSLKRNRLRTLDLPIF